MRSKIIHENTQRTWHTKGTQKMFSIIILTLLVPKALALSEMPYSAAGKATKEKSKGSDSPFLLLFS